MVSRSGPLFAWSRHIWLVGLGLCYLLLKEGLNNYEIKVSLILFQNLSYKNIM